jgi:hypothetical protein
MAELDAAWRVLVIEVVEATGVARFVRWLAARLRENR